MDVVSSVVPSSSCVQMSQVFAVIFPTSSWLIKTQKFISSFQTWWWWDSPSVTLFIVICGGGGDLRMDMWGAPVVVSTLCPRQQVKNCNMNTREAKVDDDGQIISFYTSLRWSGSTKTCQDPRFYSMPFFYFFFFLPYNKVVSVCSLGCCRRLFLLFVDVVVGGRGLKRWKICVQRKENNCRCVWPGCRRYYTRCRRYNNDQTYFILFVLDGSNNLSSTQLSWPRCRCCYCCCESFSDAVAQMAV